MNTTSTGSPPVFSTTSTTTAINTAINNTGYAATTWTVPSPPYESVHDKIARIRTLQEVLRDPSSTGHMKSISAAKLVKLLKEL
jgi:hypothetical protein